ncbi:MAG: hypothetical protein PF693_04240 [Spirochaetia bacterium]|jgi:hypothetical protein|nr:hypothetical protein [Spirochaetia bacterium]
MTNELKAKIELTEMFTSTNAGYLDIIDIIKKEALKKGCMSAEMTSEINRINELINPVKREAVSNEMMWNN